MNTAAGVLLLQERTDTTSPKEDLSQSTSSTRSVAMRRIATCVSKSTSRRNATFIRITTTRFLRKGNAQGKVTSLLSASILLKIAERSEAKSVKRSFASKSNYDKFSRFFALFRSVILSEIKIDNLLVIYPLRV